MNNETIVVVTNGTDHLLKDLEKWILCNISNTGNIVYKSPNICQASIEESILDGDVVIIAIFDIFTSLIVEDEVRKGLLIQRPHCQANGITKIQVDEFIHNWITLFGYYTRYQNIDGVICLNGNELGDGINFNNSLKLSEYLNIPWFTDAFNNNTLLALNNTLCDSTEVMDIRALDYSRIVICVQDIADSVYEYIDKIMASHGPASMYFIYDIGSNDSTYEVLKSKDFNRDRVSLKQFERCHVSEAATSTSIISDTYEYIIPKSKIYAKSAVEEFLNFPDSIDRNPDNIHEAPSSFATVVTNNYKLEADILIHSIRRFHNEPIFVRCDKESEEYLTSRGFNDIHFSRISQYGDNVLANKYDTASDALLICENVLLMDSDIIVTAKIEFNTHHELVLSPCGHPECDFNAGDKYGHFNTGMLFMSSTDVVNELRNLSQISLFGEQEMVYKLVTKFDCGIFEGVHNLGIQAGLPKIHSILDIPSSSDSASTIHLHLDITLNNDKNSYHLMMQYHDIFFSWLIYYHRDLYIYIKRVLAKNEIISRFGSHTDAKHQYILLSKVNVGIYSSSISNRLQNTRKVSGEYIDIAKVHTQLGSIPIDEYMDYKLDLFENISYPSVMGQTDTDFTWILYCDVNSPEAMKDRLLSYERDAFPKVKIMWTDDDFALSQELLFSSVGPEIVDDSVEILASSILDIDDGLSKDFIETMKGFVVYPAGVHNGKYIVSPENRQGLIVNNDGSYGGWVLDLVREVNAYQYIMIVEAITRSMPSYGLHTAFKRPHEYMVDLIDGDYVQVEYPFVLQSMNYASLFNGDLSNERPPIPLDNYDLKSNYSIDFNK